MQFDGTLPRRKSLFGESFMLGLIYLALIALVYLGAAYFAQAQFGSANAQAYSGNFFALDIASGLLSFSAVSLGVWHLRGQSMIYNFAACFAIATVVALVDFLIVCSLTKFILLDQEVDILAADNLKLLLFCWATYFGWTCIFLTLLYSHDVRERERRLAMVSQEAQSAQLRALRYQVNPHFLFNSLNSVAGLIEEGAGPRAERMVLSLSNFLRTTLTLDALHDVRLADELAVLQGYLWIEHERFSDRMTFDVAVSEQVGKAMLPSLILQPLVENAIKHGVGAMPGKVHIALTARREDDRLRVSLENDMPPEPTGTRPAGTSVGLRNVADRLRARFHDQAQFSAGPVSPGRFRATLDMPWRTE